MNQTLFAECAIIKALTTLATPIETIYRIRADIKTKHFSKGEFIFVDGQEVQSLVGINSGLAKMYYMDHFGNEFTLRILSAGSVIGHRHVLDGDAFTGYVQVLEDVEVCILPKKSFIQLLNEELSINKQIIDMLCSDLRVTKEIIANLSLKDVKHRICSILIKLHKQFSEPGSDEINAEISREDFAKLVGVARESLSRSLSELVAEGIISIEKKRIKVLDWNKLHQLSKI